MEALKSKPIHYPDSDGQPMADNTLQFQWIVTIKENLDAALPDFVAGDLLWYPVQGKPKIRAAPDVLVAFGRPKGHRGSYKQWEEGDVAPQVVFEILSPGNTVPEMINKCYFYERHGVEEFYLYDPNRENLSGWKRQGDKLSAIPEMNGWTSPRLGIRFDTDGDTLRLLHADGSPFLTFAELKQRMDSERVAREAAQAERDAAQAERDTERTAREAAERDARRAERRAERLAERLRAMGVDLEE